MDNSTLMAIIYPFQKLLSQIDSLILIHRVLLNISLEVTFEVLKYHIDLTLIKVLLILQYHTALQHLDGQVTLSKKSLLTWFEVFPLHSVPFLSF